jgi:hypothetical protein
MPLGKNSDRSRLGWEQQGMSNYPNISLVVTSCDRHSLLQQTLESLNRNLPGRLAETIIIEDGDKPAPAFFRNFPNLGNLTWLNSGGRMGQWWCVDRAYQHVKTPLILHFEDDWAVRAPFLDESLKILEQYPEIFTVSLRGAFCNGHPLAKDPNYPFQILRPGWQHFGSFTMNPGLRRLSDYKRIGTYGKHCGYHSGGIAPEMALNDVYEGLGYRIASLPPDNKQIVEHLGHQCSKAKERFAPPYKVLIAIPACHSYRYGVHTAAFHSDSQPNRIDAQRSTWLKDVKAQSHFMDYRFFYGSPSPQGFVPKPDEVLLDCGDTYEALPQKVRAIYKYALDHGYTHVYKADDDTYCRVDRLILSDFRLHDQCGFKYDGDSKYVTGGAGYTLNRRAMQAVVGETPNHWAEDLWVGSVMRSRGFDRFPDKRFVPGFDAHYIDIAKLPDDFISCHACKPEQMEILRREKP